METRPNGYQWTLIVLLFLSWGVVFLDRMTVLYLGPFIGPALHLNAEQIGFLASILAICWALSAFVFGNVSDRVGRRRVLLPAMFAFSILSWLSGVARSFSQLVIIRGIMGVAEGPTWPTITATITEESPADVRGRNSGLVVSATGLVGLGAAPVLATQVAAHLGWRTAFFVAGVPGIILGLILWRYMREPLRRVQHEVIAERPGQVWEALRHRNIWLSCLSSIGFMTWLWVTSSFAPLFLTQVMHEAPTTAGFVLGAGGVGSFLWGFGVPWISDRIGRRWALLLFGLLSAGVPLACLWVGDHSALAALLLLLTWAGQGCATLTLVLIPTESVSPTLAGTAIGLATMVGELFGGTAAPAISGMVAVHLGLAATMWIAAAGAVVMGLSALPMLETAPRLVHRPSRLVASPTPDLSSSTR